MKCLLLLGSSDMGTRYQANSLSPEQIKRSYRSKYMTYLAAAAITRREQRRTLCMVEEHLKNKLPWDVLNNSIAKAACADVELRALVEVLDYYHKYFEVNFREPIPRRYELIDDDAWLVDIWEHGIEVLPLQDPVFPPSAV